MPKGIPRAPRPSDFTLRCEARISLLDVHEQMSDCSPHKVTHIMLRDWVAIIGNALSKAEVPQYGEDEEV